MLDNSMLAPKQRPAVKIFFPYKKTSPKPAVLCLFTEIY